MDALGFEQTHSSVVTIVNRVVTRAKVSIGGDETGRSQEEEGWTQTINKKTATLRKENEKLATVNSTARTDKTRQVTLTPPPHTRQSVRPPVRRVQKSASRLGVNPAPTGYRCYRRCAPFSDTVKLLSNPIQKKTDFEKKYRKCKTRWTIPWTSFVMKKICYC